ncbi:hypothetical protein RND71_038070 [Anisodus tanguticus]|uniref:Uncharacterized protein n=1 Tax=Anisodus tanguticus TaxID=243964 RepID=A0AAE1QYC4_9SOLA|nr:hypothetical protein RND71_038070 [Anisodus tanguticus]
MGDCALLNEVFSLVNNDGAPNKTTLLIKVQNSYNLQASPSFVSSEKKSKRVTLFVGSITGASIDWICIFITCFAFLCKRKKGLEEAEEEFLDQVPGMPTRFSYEELTVMTENFSKKLGEGGFGSIIEGIMSDGTKIARKAVETQLFEMVDKNSEDMQLNREEAVEMMKIAAWCLQSDYTKRPSMSLVVKVLQGLVAAETNLDYTFPYPPNIRTVAEANEEREAVGISLPFPSQLSGPR